MFHMGSMSGSSDASVALGSKPGCANDTRLAKVLRRASL